MGRRTRERWLLTRKTWRYMTEAGRRLLTDTTDPRAIERRFAEVCRAEPRFIVWQRKQSYPGATRSITERLQRHLSLETLHEHTRATTAGFRSCGTQTEPQRVVEPQAPPPPVEAPKSPSRRTDDVSESVGDTIKRYLRMARRKASAGDAKRFTSVNYDRMVVPSVATDTECDKGAQTELTGSDVDLQPQPMADAPNLVHKSKSSGNVAPLLSRRIWRGRSKSQTRPCADVQPTKAQWTPQGKGVWASSEGRRMELQDVDLQELSPIERKMLQRVAATKLQELNFGSTAGPLEGTTATEVAKEKPKRRALLLKRKALTTGFFDAGKKDEARTSATFGVPLEQCLANEVRALTRPHVRAGSCESLPSRPAMAPPIGEALSQQDVRNDASPRVPALVRACIRHLVAHGLTTVGLFRVSPARRRVRHLREEWERSGGAGVTLDTGHCPHDVATLLKEFLRDLPEPLLCSALYTTFLATQRIRNRRLQLEALAHLVRLLPAAHRDTLRTLLAFLGDVAAAADANRMDANNLATVFAPNILRTTQDRVEERLDAINVIRTMIDHQEELFRVPACLLDAAYAEMMDSHGQALDRLCERRAAEAPEERRRMSSPLVLHGSGVLSASLRIPVTVAPLHVGDHLEDIPYIEDSSATEARATVTGSLSLAASPSAVGERQFFAEESRRRPVGGAVMRSKTEDFERLRARAPVGRQAVYKRREIISSAPARK